MKKAGYLLLILFLLSSCGKKDEACKMYDFGSGEYKQPFRGLLKNEPKILVKSLQYPPFKWLAPDTLELKKDFEIVFNEEAIRSKAVANISFCNSANQIVPHLQFYANGKPFINGQYTIHANSLVKELCIKCRIDPKFGEKAVVGFVNINGKDLDNVNNFNLISQEYNRVADWQIEQEYKRPYLLWLLWLLTAIIIIALILYILYLLYQLLSLLLTSLPNIPIIRIMMLPTSVIKSMVTDYRSKKEKKKEKKNKKNKEKPIKLFGSVTKILADGNEEVNFTVKQDNVDVTSECEIYINDNTIEGYRFTTTTAGNYKAYAKKDDLVSNDFNIIAEKKTIAERIALVKKTANEVDTSLTDSHIQKMKRQKDFDSLSPSMQKSVDQYFNIKYSNSGYNNIPKTGGTWSGEPGNSYWRPDINTIPRKNYYSNPKEKKWKEILDSHNVKNGIKFKDGEPVFDNIVWEKVILQYEDIGRDKLLKLQNPEIKDYEDLHNLAFEHLARNKGWSIEKARKYKEKNNLVWHALSDCKTLVLIPREIHDHIRHYGGVAMLRCLEL